MTFKTLPPLFLLLIALMGGFGVLRPAPAAGEELLVFAAASLSESFTDLARDFEAGHPGVHVVCNFAGSQVLATQIGRGAEADLFAAANAEVMAPLLGKDQVEKPVLFAGNELVLIVPRSLAALLPDFRSVAGPGKLLVIGTPQAPVGAYTRQFLDKLASDPAYGADFVAAVRGNVVSEETNVKAIVAKVSLGEVDGGIVYHTDLTPQVQGKVILRALPAGDLPRIFYPIALVRGSTHRASAVRFLNHLQSPAGREILARHGFSRGEAGHEQAR